MTKQGKLVDRAEAEAAFFDEARAIRDAWLAWPARVAIEMADALKVDARTLTQVLATYVQQHLAELGEPSGPDLGTLRPADTGSLRRSWRRGLTRRRTSTWCSGRSGTGS